MKNINTFSGLGPKEAEFVARLSYEKKTIVTADEIDKFLPADFKYRRQFVYTLKQKRVLTPIKGGVYIFTPLDSIATGTRVHEFLIPAVFLPRGNYYLGYSVMFNYYGFTEQIFQTVYVINTSLCKEKMVCGIAYKFVKVPEKRMYGIEKITVQGVTVPVSSKERTLVDLIYFNKPVGGVIPAVQILKDTVKRKQCDIGKLVEMASRFPNITARKRIGVTLEGLGVGCAVLKPLIKSVEKTAINSLEDSRKGSLNTTWRVIVGDPRK
ncbi:MAG: type IV toxin-antitoxin system AbiEi family antitoxin [Candidatus Omnitrophota bacterium]